MNKTLDLTEEIISGPLIIGAEAFTSEEYARTEADKLWPKVWQQAGRVEEIPNVGDYITYDIMNDTILITRSDPDTINAFYNVCAHRGRRLADGCGHTKQFRCQYHAWKYNLKGEVIHILDDVDWQGAISKESLKIPEVKVDAWGGWIWINMDPNAEPLRKYLDPLASLLDPFEFEKMRFRWRKWGVFDCNWKAALEAFIEAYHVEGTHPQLLPYANFYTWSTTDGLHSHKGFDERGVKKMSESTTYFRPGKGDDARVSIAKMQKEILRTAHASTTQVFVDAAQRLVDELPADTAPGDVVKHWLASTRRDYENMGVSWPALTSEQLGKAGNSCHIFPNLAIAYGFTFALVYRVRPYGADPSKCIFDAAVIERFPEGKEPKTEWVHVPPGDDDQWPPVMVQDFHNMPQVQRGMASRGFRGTIPNPKQEQTVSNLHRNLARFMGEGAPRPYKGPNPYKT